MLRRILVLIFVTLISSTSTAQTISVRYKGKQIVGKPVFWNDYTVKVMERDGKVSEFPPNQVKDYKVLSKDFKLFSYGELKAKLEREFGKTFNVTGTGQYLVVHPAGQSDLWANRFEELYRSMLHYYRVRQISVSSSPLPFIAIVFPTRGMYESYSAKVLGNSASGTLGFYSGETNRIYLFDSTNGSRNASWQTNAETIVHEAAHQTAFNIGVHRRFAGTPRWVIEGIGTLFEAPGVYDGQRYPEQKQRINHEQLRNFTNSVDDTNATETIKNIIVSDKLFSRSQTKAYATAWAITFYATETRPKEYARYIKLLYRRKAFSSVSASERLRDFRTAFGDASRFVPQMLSYYRSLDTTTKQVSTQ